MLALYLASLGFGSTLILVSLFLGGGDKELEKDFDKDLDKDFDKDLDKDFDKELEVEGPEADADAEVEAEAEVEGDAEVGGDAEVEGDADAEADAGAEAHAAPEVHTEPFWLPFLSMRFWTFGAAAFGLSGTLLTLLVVPWILALVVSLLAGGAAGTGAAWFFRALKKDQVSGETRLDRFAGEEARVLLAVRPGQPGKIAVQTLAGRVEMLATTRDANPIEPGSTVIVASVRDGVADVSRLPDAHDEARKRKARAAAAQQRTSG